MDNSFFIYIFKVSIAISFFMVLYYLCLRNDTFLRLRRAYFIFTLFFSILYPLSTFEMKVPEDTTIPTAFWLSQVEIGAEPTSTSQSILNLSTIIFTILAGVVLLLSLRFIIQLASIIRLKLNNKSEKANGFSLIKLETNNIDAFSFFNWIFINIDNTDSEKQKEIITHELVHVQQMHSIDILIAEIFCIIFWWNPFAWLLKREIKINLEYLADRGVLEKGYDPCKYQYLLLQTSNNENGIPIINNFNVSQLKKRIIMMNKRKTSLTKSIKYLLVLPVCFTLVLGNAMQASEMILPYTDDSQIQAADTIIPETKEKTETISTVKITGYKEDTKDNKPLMLVEQMPVFPGGEDEMMKYIKNNLKYPISAQEASIEGRVTIRFIVQKDGSVTDATIIRGIHPDCDSEALRVVKNMPKWRPGRQSGQDVAVYFTLPIAFKLTKESKGLTLNQPVNALVVLDGKIVDSETLKSINNETIDKVEVIKDAEKMAAYGDAAKGKDGVILITSKK